MTNSARMYLLRAVVAGVVVVLLGGLISTSGADASASRNKANVSATDSSLQLLTTEHLDVALAESKSTAVLPTIAGKLAPPTPAHLFKSPLPSHQVVGFIGAAGFAGVTAAEFADTSALVTNPVSISANGSLTQSSPGWAGVTDMEFPTFVGTAHGDGDHVLLGVSTGSAAVIARLLQTPTTSAAHLATQVNSVLGSAHLDGIDIDIEGDTPAERGKFVTFVTVLARLVRAQQATADIVLNVVPQAAAERGFFDVGALARQVNDLFVMAYDMVDPTHASPNAPLASPTLGLSDVQSLIQYLAVVPATKLILGAPFYGYDFPTRSSTLGAKAIGPAESVTYGAPGGIVAVGHVGLWDTASLTPYYVFKRGKTWHQTWYDDPVSIALKTALASDLHLAGMGAWELGYEGNQTAMLEALDGDSSPVKYSKS